MGAFVVPALGPRCTATALAGLSSTDARVLLRLGLAMWLLMLMIVLTAGCQPPRTVVDARGVLAAPDRFYDQGIVLVGQAQSVRLRAPEHGNSYTHFVLADGSGRVPVFGWGTLDIASGDLVEVRGAYRAVVHAGSDVLRDTIEALFVRRLRAAGQVPGTPSGPP
jgi:hypothetical protein